MDETSHQVGFEIGRTNPHVRVSPTQRENVDAMDYWDGNWLMATVTIAAGAFHGSFEAQLRADEFERFRDQLRVLYEDLGGRATFEPIEPWLVIVVQGDGKGHLRAKCRADDQPGIGNLLNFEIAFDQTELTPLMRQLDAICDAFPVIAGPPKRKT